MNTPTSETIAAILKLAAARGVHAPVVSIQSVPSVSSLDPDRVLIDTFIARVGEHDRASAYATVTAQEPSVDAAIESLLQTLKASILSDATAAELKAGELRALAHAHDPAEVIAAE